MLALPQYFVLANLASLIAFYQFLRGERYTHWDPNREGTTTPQRHVNDRTAMKFVNRLIVRKH